MASTSGSRKRPRTPSSPARAVASSSSDSKPSFSDVPEFQPDLTPEQMFRKGIYGGSYFRDIDSKVAGKKLSGFDKEFPFLADIPKKLVTNPTYDVSVNFYKAKASQTLKFWEDSGWIKAPDYYGYIQWYCRFWMGRRSPDDRRQIARCLRVLLRFGQRTLTPGIKQTLLHWGWDPEKDHSQYLADIKKNGWARI